MNEDPEKTLDFFKKRLKNPFDVSNFERIKEDDLSKIPDENSGWDAEF